MPQSVRFGWFRRFDPWPRQFTDNHGKARYPQVATNIPDEIDEVLLILRNRRFAGRPVRLLTSHPDFPDRKLSATVNAKCEALDLEWLALVEPMTDADADRLLAQAGV